MKPDLGDVEAHCAVLGRLASAHPEGSPEHAALLAAAYAMHFVRHTETQARFRDWVASWSGPPTALQVLHAKLAGIEDFPHELLDDSMREVERALEKLRHVRS